MSYCFIDKNFSMLNTQEDSKMNGRLSITHVAKSIGVTPRTIMRWEKAGKIKRSKRDWRGWRFYLHEDMESIRKFYESSYEDYNERSRMVENLTKVAMIVILALSLMAASSIYSIVLAESAAAAPSSGAIKETKTTVDINLSNLPTVGSPSYSPDEASKYTLGPDDLIEIEVRRHPEFSGQYSVNSEGKIEYKFVGDIPVTGLTKNQLTQKLTEILSEYVIEPDVNIRIMAYLSKVFYVVGEVNRPGKFYMKGNSVTVLEAIIQAGLPNQAASTRRCRLITPDQKGKNKYKDVNIYELLYGGDMNCNREMKPGDILYVPSTVIAKIIRVVSPVTNAVSEAAGSAAAGAGMVAVGL